jgi:hypothetical protein
VRLLLPPSEAKSAGGRGAPLEPGRWGDDPVLATARRQLAVAVEATAMGDRDQAATAFVLPPAVVDAALAANSMIRRARTRRALDRYAGVVYEGFDVATLTTAQRRWADRSVLVFSGLFGIVAGREQIPDYRVPAAAVLPALGSVAAFWRPILADAVPGRLGRRGLVLDLRSSDYATLWRPSADLVRRVVPVRMLSRRPDGTYGVISYNSKHAKGRLARSVIEVLADGGSLRSPGDVAELWAAREGGAAEIHERSGRVQLDLLMPS